MRVRIHHLQEMKQRGQKWAMLTAYDMYTAATFDEAGIPVLLVGDSASNNVFGNETSLPVTVEELIPLVRAVTRSAHHALVIADLPFGSYQSSPEQCFHTAVRAHRRSCGRGFVASLDVRPLTPPRPGRTTAWVSTGVDLVAGETVSPLACYIALVDIANGIAARQSPTTWMFPNVDLTIHLHRQPHGPWTGLDTTVIFGPTGQGITSTVLHDLTGPVGYAQQILTVRPLHAAG